MTKVYGKDSDQLTMTITVQHARLLAATAAMQALIQREAMIEVSLQERSHINSTSIAHEAARFADALINALKETEDSHV